MLFLLEPTAPTEAATSLVGVYVAIAGLVVVLLGFLWKFSADFATVKEMLRASAPKLAKVDEHETQLARLDERVKDLETPAVAYRAPHHTQP